MEQSATVVDVADSDDLAWLDRCLVEQRMTLIKQSHNAKLWFQYLDCITVIKDVIMSERTANWEWHLSAVGKLLNLFAACQLHKAREIISSSYASAFGNTSAAI